MIRAGFALLLLGAFWELDIYLRGAWPTALSWLVMIAGLGLIAAGATRRGGHSATIAWSAFGVFVVALLLLWASG